MTENKHTPGPWRITDGCAIMAQFGGQEAQIAMLSHTRWSYPDDGKTRRLSEQSPANARLITAAPDLLAALEFILEQAEDMLDVCELESQDCLSHYEAIEQARNALALARGEET